MPPPLEKFFQILRLFRGGGGHIKNAIRKNFLGEILENRKPLSTLLRNFAEIPAFSSMNLPRQLSNRVFILSETIFKTLLRLPPTPPNYHKAHHLINMARRIKIFKFPNLLKPPKRRKKGPLQKMNEWHKGIQKQPFGPMGWW